MSVLGRKRETWIFHAQNHEKYHYNLSYDEPHSLSLLVCLCVHDDFHHHLLSDIFSQTFFDVCWIYMKINFIGLWMEWLTVRHSGWEIRNRDPFEKFINKTLAARWWVKIEKMTLDQSYRIRSYEHGKLKKCCAIICNWESVKKWVYSISNSLLFIFNPGGKMRNAHRAYINSINTIREWSGHVTASTAMRMEVYVSKWR